MGFIQKVFKLLKPFHKQLVIIFIVTAVFEVARNGGPFIFGKILDLLIKTDGKVTLYTAVAVVLGLIGVRVLSLVIDIVADLLALRLSIGAEKYMSNFSFRKLLELSLDYHEKVNTGTKISIINKGIDRLISLLDNFLFEFQPIVLQLIISIVFIALVNWRIGLIFAFSLIPFILITTKIFKSTQKLREKRHDAYEVSSGEIGDVITNITVVKAFAQEQREIKSFSDLREFISRVTAKEYNRMFIAGFGRNLLIELFYGIILALGLIEIGQNALTVGGLVFLINLTERAYSNIYRLGRTFERAVDASEAVDRLNDLTKRQSTVKNAPDAIKPDTIEGEISFKNVTFAYRQKIVLEDVSFTIPAGSFTALVGKSGSGKSTIAKLLSRYYDPNGGQIIIDAKYDLRKIDLDTYRESTAVVFQDSPVPNRRIWEIISYAAGKKSFASIKDRVIEAAKLAHAHEFIMELDNGYQTLVGERGV